jgi:hypothetical protein
MENVNQLRLFSLMNVGTIRSSSARSLGSVTGDKIAILSAPAARHRREMPSAWMTFYFKIFGGTLIEPQSVPRWRSAQDRYWSS